MHISDGIVSAPIAISLGIASVVICTYSLKKLKNENIALLCSMGALFFIASFIHVPIGPSQIHLMLIGFIGVVLGIEVFLAIAIALLLQALLLGYGGLTSLGVNIIVMALPAYAVYLLIKIKLFKTIPEKIKFFLIGSLGILFSSILLSLVLILSKDEYVYASFMVILANLPGMFIEGLLTIFLFSYIKKTLPEIYEKIGL